MVKLQKVLSGLALAFVALFGFSSQALAQFDATDVDGLVSSTTDTISSVLETSLPAVVGIMAALIGLGLLIRYIKRWVGRK